MGVLPVDMMKPLPEPEKEKPKPKLNETEIFDVGRSKEENTQPPAASQPQQDTNEIKPITEKKAPRGKSQDPEHLKKMREASALRRAQRKREKEEAEKIIAEAKLIKEQELAKRMSQPNNGNANQSFDYDKLAEAIEKRKRQNVPQPQGQTPPRVEHSVAAAAAAPQPKPQPQPTIDYKKKYEQTQIQLFEERVRADERKRISQERQTKMNKVASNNLKVPKALRKYQERASAYAENNKNNPWDSFFK